MWSCVLNEEAVVAATASADFSTRLWNALTGDEVHQFQHSHIARTVAFARRSPRLLSAGALLGRAVVWPDLPNRRYCSSLFLCSSLYVLFVRSVRRRTKFSRHSSAGKMHNCVLGQCSLVLWRCR